MKHRINEKEVLRRKFTFSSFKKSIDFVNKIVVLAEKQNHHPKITIDYSDVTLELFTHDENNSITEKDYKLAESINNLSYEN